MLDNILPKTEKLSKDEIAELLKVDKKAFEKFEETYRKNILNEVSDNFFEINSRQAAEEKRGIDITSETIEGLHELKEKIVNELLAQTEVYTYDGRKGEYKTMPALPDGTEAVNIKDIIKYPAALRPQLSGNLMKKDIKDDAHPEILYFYKRFLEEKDIKKKQYCYHMFRQGLDILDLDEVTYRIIGTNPNAMGFWFPALVEACKGQEFFKIPATTIAKVPITLLQLTRQEYQSLSRTTLDIVDEWAYKAFNLDEEKEYFIKTGTYSSKFDFRNAYVHEAKEVRELGEYLLFVHFQALMMASPLTKPVIYGVSTTNEWVVREFIKDKENNPCIYKGMPLHTEYRVFVDCDTDKVIGISPYWEPKTMLKRFSSSSDANSPHQMHDYVVYKAHEFELMKRYKENHNKVSWNIQDMLPRLNLTGQWSIDVMQNGDDFWIIDMARAENSAFYECIPKPLRNPSAENWIPEFSNK